MTDSEQYTLVEAAPDDFETMLWSPTRPDKNSFQPESANSGGSWRTQLGPIPPELLRAQEEFAATLEADCDRVSSFSRSSDYDDQGAIVGDLKKALPALLQENVALRERLYSQSDIEPGASPTADHVHEKIVNEQCKPRRKHVSRLPPDIPEYTHRHRPLLVPKTPPGSPPLKLPHFGSVSTLAAEDAPLQSQLLNENGNRNIHMLQSMRTNEIMADLAFTARLSSRPRLPEAASANEIVFLLKTQAQRRRKQIHDERTGQSMFLGQERRAVRRRLKHVSLGKDDDVWPPSTAPHPVHEYSGMDEDKVAILIVSPAKVCPDCKGPKTEQIPMFDDSAARVDEFLSAQHTIEATTTKLQMISHHYSTSTGTMTGERNADANARGTSSGRSIYLHPNAPINPDSASSIHFQFTPAPGCYKAREASIDMVERFFAPVSKEPKAEPTKRTRPLKAKIAGFEEHSKRGLKRKQRPESLSNHSTVYVTTKALRSPLSPCSRNVGASIGRRFSHRDGHGSPKISSTAGVSDPYSAERSQISSYMPSTLDIQDQENLHPDTEEPAQTQFSPAYSIPSQPSLIHSPTHNPGQKPWNYDFSFASQVPVPVPPSTVPNTPCQPFSQSKQQQRCGPVVFTEEGLGKAMVYSLNKNTNDETSKEKSPSSVSIDSLKAKEYLRHLNEHVENLCQERDQAVQRAGVLEKEVVRLRLNVRMLERELNGPAQRDLQGKDEPALSVK